MNGSAEHICPKASCVKRMFRILLRILLFLCFFLPAVLIQNKQLNLVRSHPRLYRDSLYLPSGRSIRLVSVGYDRFMADFIWLRSIQAFGGHWGTDQNYKPIFHLFDVITDLDPNFLDAYTFGNLVIGDEGGDQILGLQLIDKGILKNPRKYKISYWGGYVAYWQMNNPDLAKYYYARALKCPDVPDFVPRILAYMEMKSGRYQVAFEKYLQDWLAAIDERDDVVVGIVRRRIPDILSEWNLFILRQAVNKYIQNTGHEPKNLKDLEIANTIDPYPLVVVPALFQSVEYYRQMPDKIMKHLQDIIDASTRKDTIRIPPHPRGYWYQLNPDVYAGSEVNVLDGEKMVENLEMLLSRLRAIIFNYKCAKGRFPLSIQEFYPKIKNTPEPFGGEWVYIPAVGRLYSSTMPFL